MGEPWQKQKGETAKSYGAFFDYLHMGPGRKLTDCAAEFGHRYKSIETWSWKHNWADRAAAYDAHELTAAAALHEQRRAEIRQRLMDRGLDMAEIVLSTADGLIADPCRCENRGPDEPCRCGAWAPIRDREGNYIGDKPMVPASTRQIAAIAVLDRCAITVPKRVELTGADGKALQIEARGLLGGMSQAQLDALAAHFPSDDGSE